MTSGTHVLCNGDNSGTLNALATGALAASLLPGEIVSEARRLVELFKPIFLRAAIQ